MMFVHFAINWSINIVTSLDGCLGVLSSYFFFSVSFFLFGYTFQLYCSIVVYLYFNIFFSKFFSAHSVSYS